MTLTDVLRIILVGFLPWGPAYLFERSTFALQVANSSLFGWFTGTRIEADVAAFALGGILIAYLLRPRLAILQIFLSTVVTWTLFYQVCETFRVGLNGRYYSECYLSGPDGLEGYRLGLMLFCSGALPALVKAAPRIGQSVNKWRPIIGIFAGITISTMMTWFPMAAWFSGISYTQPLLPIHAAVIFGLPEIACGILAARIGRSIWIAALSGIISATLLTGSLWTLLCPGCDRSLLGIMVPAWGLFALLGGFLELGPGRSSGKLTRFLLEHLPTLQQVALAAAVTVSLWTLVAYPFWEPSVLYASSISPQSSPLVLGLPVYRPYVAGYYDSLQYRICCLEIGVSITKADPSLIPPGNFLMAGMGVQSPNCCIDGWDFGWRADVFLLHDGTILVSGTSWETCDGNANCGGHLWQHMRYHVQQIVTAADRSTPIYLRMMWESGQANWYFNTTGVPWTKFGTFTPDWREGNYFDIGLIGPLQETNPYHHVFFYQFGIASNAPVPEWSVTFLHPSFQYQGSWKRMEKAGIVQGDLSFWKGAFRWGGSPYIGVTAKANYQDPSMEKGIVEFSYTGNSMTTYTPLW